MLELPWTGDLTDDCVCALGEWLAHCECMGSTIVRDDGERRGKPVGYWFVAVYRGNTAIFHSSEHAGLILGPDMARAIASAVLLGAISEVAGPKGTLLLRALGAHERTLDELADAIRHDKNSVRVAAGRLCARGLIERRARGRYAIPKVPDMRFTP